MKKLTYKEGEAKNKKNEKDQEEIKFTDAELLGIETDPRKITKSKASDVGNVGTIIYHYDTDDKRNGNPDPKLIRKYL